MNHFHEIKHNNYLSSLVKDDNKFIYARYVVNNVNIDNFDKIFNNYGSNHNKKFDFCYMNCEFRLETNNRLLNVEINFHHNTDYINLKTYFFFILNLMELKILKFIIRL